MTILLYLGLILLASLVTIKSVNMFISSSSRLAQHLGISKYTISFLLVAVATSLPEAVVGITSAIKKTPILAFGDSMGSNITLLTIIIAIPVLLGTKMVTRRMLHSKDIYYATFFSFLPLIMATDNVISQIEGIILLISYAVYSAAVLRQSTGLERLLGSFEKTNIWRELAVFIISLSVLLGASQGIVYAALGISRMLGLALGFVGLTMTSLGTSLPEIAFVTSAIKKGTQDEILGDVVGSVVANSTLVLGIAATIYPINLGDTHFSISTTFFLVISILLFLKFTKSKESLDRTEGAILLCLYFLFIATEYYIQRTI